MEETQLFLAPPILFLVVTQKHNWLNFNQFLQDHIITLFAKLIHTLINKSCGHSLIHKVIFTTFH
ncbi:hypothetical protein Psal071_01786 [Piscirickettsia salmonis]|uniref:Uncharacterized protein n=1 Tax=Piscirickettsia salmonis TaxID=1238 RepID=A0A9Q6LS34_PISSA|nr:hypothetical protein KW89_1696 [Piscirickettsia salmonis]ERL61914.1 hypothetical protein K661_01735 [Piscirickettsia salmonis LF-89 = ATCC VR-1361]QGN77044.1 hypothetical protein Psal001_01246 [Piscirickettsia salmonis]QGN80633.1 hypothetical protein Psal002_01270 [Piscirickettsia salmonis]QGN85094.1 hypothetical protein Psal003_02161 [Piscirickettsia salmonis]